MIEFTKFRTELIFCKQSLEVPIKFTGCHFHFRKEKNMPLNFADQALLLSTIPSRRSPLPRSLP